jgi:hypothetical protein
MKDYIRHATAFALMNNCHLPTSCLGPTGGSTAWEVLSWGLIDWGSVILLEHARAIMRLS